MSLKDFETLKSELQDVMRDTVADSMKHFSSQNAALDRPFTQDQLGFIVQIAANIAAEIIFQYNDIDLFFNEHPDLKRSDRDPSDASDIPPTLRDRPRVIPFPVPDQSE